MADDQERAALHGQMAALQKHMEETHQNLPNLPARPVKHFIVQSMVFEDCVDLPIPVTRTSRFHRSERPASRWKRA